MLQNIYAYLEEIEKNHLKIKNAQSALEALIEQHNKEKEPLLTSISQQQSQVAAMENKQVYAEFSDIVQHVAEQWGTTSDQLQIAYRTDRNYSTFSEDAHIDAMKFNQQEKDISLVKILFYFTISNPNKISQQLSFTSALPLDAIQKDGKRFSQHISAEAPKIDNKYYYCYKIDDLQQIILPFTLRSLALHAKRNDASRSILDAVEDYKQKHQSDMTL